MDVIISKKWYIRKGQGDGQESHQGREEDPKNPP
jgi:hypothetical protein